MIGSVATAVAASICCIGPILAVTFGFTSLVGLARYEPVRPFMVAATVALLAWTFYVTYRRPPAEECDPDSLCETLGADRVRRVRFLGDGKAEQRQPHADKNLIAVANFPRRRGDH